MRRRNMKDANVGVKLPMGLVFLFIICLPLVDGFFNVIPEQRLQEKRKPEQPEVFVFDSVFQYIQQYTRYFNDSFFYRGPLIRFHNKIKYQWFNVSGVPKVIIGKDGWLFQARKSEEPGTPGYFPSIQLFTPRQLEEWTRLVEQRRRWLAKRGIDYLLILVPDKGSVYPEYLPDSLQPFYHRSRLAQLAAYLRTHSTVPVLDLRNTLLPAKKDVLLYCKTDSHWNRYGACIAAHAIINRLSERFPNIEPLNLSDFQLRIRGKRKGGNLALMLSLQRTLFREEWVGMIPRVPFRAEKAPSSVKNPHTVKGEAFQRSGSGFPRAVMFHDSFGVRLKRYLSEHFSRILYLRDWGFRFHVDEVKEDAPAIVLDEISEFFLYGAIFDNSPIDNSKE